MNAPANYISHRSAFGWKTVISAAADWDHVPSKQETHTVDLFWLVLINALSSQKKTLWERQALTQCCAQNGKAENCFKDYLCNINAAGKLKCDCTYINWKPVIFFLFDSVPKALIYIKWIQNMSWILLLHCVCYVCWMLACHVNQMMLKSWN